MLRVMSVIMCFIVGAGDRRVGVERTVDVLLKRTKNRVLRESKISQCLC